MLRNIRLLWGIIGCLVVMLIFVGWKYDRVMSTKTLATVGDSRIGEEDLDVELKQLYGKLVLDKMINREVVEQVAKQNGITVSTEEIETKWKQLQGRIESSKTRDGSELIDSALSQKLKDELRYTLLLEKIATTDVVVSDKDAYDYYQQNRQRYNQPPKARLEAIYTKSRKDVEQVIGEIDKGADFRTLAKERSSDLMTAASGGDIGWVSLIGDDVDLEIRQAALRLNVEEISPPIQLNKGYVIIKVTSKTEAIHLTFEQVKDEVKREVALSQVGSLEKVLDKLKQSRHVEVYQSM